MQNQIRKRRQDVELTQEQLAQRVGVSRQTVISLESGRYHPSLVLAHKIAQVFGCFIEEIFSFEGDENL